MLYLFSGDDGVPPLLQYLAYMFLGTSGNSRKKVLTRVTVAGLTPARCTVKGYRGKVPEDFKDPVGNQREKFCICRATH